MDQITAAKQFATLHHVIRKGQMYGVLPYTHHLQAVEEILREFGESRVMILTAAWLHDVIEDTDVKLRDIEENFGEDVALLVGAVTSEPGDNRKMRNALTYPKIRSAGPLAVRLKLADRLANVKSGGGSLKMYIKEYADFRHQLFNVNDILNVPMWNMLDKLMDLNTVEHSMKL